MQQLQTAGLSIAYLDQGEGPGVIVCHCSSASHKEWLPLIESLTPEWRVLAPDFIGYGQSDAWPRGRPFEIGADVGILTALAKITEGPLHLVGHSYGAALALEAARGLGPRVKSLTLVEPVTLHLLKLEGRPEWLEVEELGIAVLDAVTNGDDRAAAASFMSYWLGRWRWSLSPEKFKTAIAATIRKVALEFTIAIEADTPLRSYAEISAPARLIMGSKTRAPARAVVDLLAATLPAAQVQVLKGAGHMSPFTHTAEINRLVRENLAARR